MAVGANIKFGGMQKALWAAFNKLLFRNKATTKFNVKRRICYKAGAPATNTEADSPGSADGVGVLCIDLTNGDIYVCTAYTNDTTHTWVKVTA